MVAATPLADTAGLPGHCCIPGCGRPAPTQLCRRCFAVYADQDGALPAWVLGLRREATRLAVREHRARRAGFSEESIEDLLLRIATCTTRGSASPPRRLHRKGEKPPPVAPQVTAVVSGPDALALLRRYCSSGVPLDMPAFLALLGDLFGWPPPGALVDTRHREALIDLYEAVYEA